MVCCQKTPFKISITTDSTIIRPNAFNNSPLGSFVIESHGKYIKNPDGEIMLDPDGNPLEKN